MLRDLTLVEHVTIESLNIDGVVLAGGMRFSWADILQGTVGDQQIEFDSALDNIGLPLFRVRSRMRHRNFDELQPMTDALVAQVGNSTGRTAYVAWAAAFHDQLSQGNRETALPPLIKILALRENAGDLSDLDQDLGLRFAEDGICLNLLPIWFDKPTIANVLLQYKDDNWNESSKIYLRSLQVEVVAWGNSMRFENRVSPWHPVLSAQSALFNGNHAEVVETLGKSDLNLNAAQRAIALYYRGLAMRAAQESDPELQSNQWQLTMLQIPAEFQNQFPELAAAAIFEVLESLPDSSAEFDSLRGELTGRFANTFHGRQYQSGRN